MPNVSYTSHEDLKDGLHRDDEQPVVISFLPFFHAYGMIGVTMLSIAGGFKVITLPRFQGEKVLSLIEKYKVRCDLAQGKRNRSCFK